MYVYMQKKAFLRAKFKASIPIPSPGIGNVKGFLQQLFPVMYKIVTARIRRMTEGNVFTLSTTAGGVPPSQV